MLNFLLISIGILVGYLLGSRFKNEPLISVIINHFLGCNKSKPCSCCQSNQIMFLPDETQPCKSFYTGLMNLLPNGCTFEAEQKLYKNRYRPRKPCKYNHGRPNEPPSALVEIFKTLDSAQESIYICMYLIKLSDIVRFLVYLKRTRKIDIRIVTNTKCDPRNCPKKELKQLQDAGVEVKTNDEGMMHNKFVIVDRKTLISGSVNWTYTAFKNNDETIIITSQFGIVVEFLKKFNQMWDQMSPYKKQQVPSVAKPERALLVGHVNCIRLARDESGNDSDDNSEPFSDRFRITRYGTDLSQTDVLGSSEDFLGSSSGTDGESSDDNVTSIDNVATRQDRSPIEI